MSKKHVKPIYSTPNYNNTEIDINYAWKVMIRANFYDLETLIKWLYFSEKMTSYDQKI